MRLSLLLLAACASAPSVEVTPTELAFGEVDFQRPLPTTGGYDPIEIRVRNGSNQPASVSIRAFDDEYLVLAAFLSSESPPTLPPLESEAESRISVGVGAYDLGQRDQLVEGTFEVMSDRDRAPVVVSWSFTPVRDIGGDTGQ